jgi:hypothetical protein
MSIRIHQEIEVNVFRIYFCHKTSSQFAEGKIMRIQGSGDELERIT